MLSRFGALFSVALLVLFFYLQVLDEEESVALDEFAKLEQRLAHKAEDEPK